MASVIQRRVATHFPPLAASVPLPRFDPAVEVGSVGALFRQTLTLRYGETFDGPRGLEIATVESGVVALEVTTATGLEFCLRRLGPGDIVVPLDLIASPAFALSYRSEETARITWQRSRAAVTGRALEAERMMLHATTELLGACIRMIHELACLPAPHRLYCELLRLSGRDGSPGFAIPPHAVLAARLCTTRETISRELSFLRRNGVISGGKDVQILKPDFLLSRISAALNLAGADEVWEAIGVA